MFFTSKSKNVSTNWFEDPLQYEVITSGSKETLEKLIYVDKVPAIDIEDLYLHCGHTTQLRVKKSALNNLTTNTFQFVKGFCLGYVCGAQ